MASNKQEAKKIIKVLMKKHDVSAEDLLDSTNVDEEVLGKETENANPGPDRRRGQPVRRRQPRQTQRKPGISDVGVTNRPSATEGSMISQGNPITRNPILGRGGKDISDRIFRRKR